jgi:polyisoprenoid-binding protein YceI
MKTILAIILSITAFNGFNTARNANAVFICDNGKIHFLASTAMEDIEATSNKTACVLDPQNRKIEAKVDMKTFEFRRKKMQDDFNEDYIESDKFPYATFTALIVSKIDFSKDGTFDVKLRGTLDMHGVKREEEIMGKLTIKGGQPVNATAKFEIPLVNYHIKIPTIVVVKIAEVVKVDVNFDFKKK